MNNIWIEKQRLWSSFRVVKTSDLSLNDIRELLIKWEIVTRSAHIWNQYPSNLALAYAWVSTLLVDKTFVERDKNYKPWTIIVWWKQFWLGGINSWFTTFQKITDKSNLWSELSALTDINPWIGFLHIESFRKLFPDANIYACNDVYFKNSEIVNNVLSWVLWYLSANKNSVNIDLTTIFDRYLLNWNLERISKIGDRYFVWKSWLSYSSDQLLEQFNLLNSWLNDLLYSSLDWNSFDEYKSKLSGPVFSNDFNVIIVEIVNSVNSWKDRVFHCSGPDFINYCDWCSAQYDLIYDIIRKTSWLELPQTFDYYLIPTALIKLLTLDLSVRGQIWNLFSLEKDIQQLGKDKWDRVKQAQKDKENIWDIIKEFDSKKRSLDSSISAAISSILSVLPREYILWHIKETSWYFTQYDLQWFNASQLSDVFEWIADIKLDDFAKVLESIKKRLKN